MSATYANAPIRNIFFSTQMYLNCPVDQVDEVVLIHFVPGFLTRAFLNTFSFLTHDLNLNLKALRLPENPFGSVIVTNIGSLGIKKALVPLVPFTRAAALISVGQITKEPRVVENRIEIRSIMHLGVTFDHRFFDGSHAAAMIRDFELYFKQ